MKSDRRIFIGKNLFYVKTDLREWLQTFDKQSCQEGGWNSSVFIGLIPLKKSIFSWMNRLICDWLYYFFVAYRINWELRKDFI